MALCDVDLFQLSQGGILDDETVARGLKNFGRDAYGVSLVYLDCTIAVNTKTQYIVNTFIS